MERIKMPDNLMARTPTSKATSERAEFIGMFLDKINEERVGTKYKPLEVSVVAMKVSHVPTGDLYAFYKQCLDADSFGAMFFYSLKVQHET